MTTSNMGLTQPTPTTATGPGWANSLNTNSGIIDVHDHSSGKGVKIGAPGLDIQSDISTNGNRLSDAKSVVFKDQSSSLASTDARGIYSLNGNLFFVNGTTDVQITNGTALAGTPGSVTGLVSPASIVFAAQNFSFFYASSTFADISCRNVSLYQGVNALQLTYGGTSSYTCTLPGTTPAQSALLVMNTSGTVSNSTSPVIGADSTGIATFNTRIGVGSTSGIEPIVADSGYLGTAAKPLGYTYVGCVEATPKVVDGYTYALADVPTFKVARIGGPKLSMDAHCPGASGTEFNFTTTSDPTGTQDPVAFFIARIRTSAYTSGPVVNRKTFSWYNKNTEQMFLSASGTLNVGGQISGSSGLDVVGPVSSGGVIASGPISSGSYGTFSGSLSSNTFATNALSCTTVAASGTVTASGAVSGSSGDFFGGVRTVIGGAYFKQLSYTTTTTTVAGEFSVVHGLDWTKIVSVTACCYYAYNPSYINCQYVAFNSSSAYGTAYSGFGNIGVSVRVVITYTA